MTSLQKLKCMTYPLFPGKDAEIEQSIYNRTSTALQIVRPPKLPMYHKGAYKPSKDGPRYMLNVLSECTPSGPAPEGCTSVSTINPSTLPTDISQQWCLIAQNDPTFSRQ